jgi:hypothetical protein
MRLRMIAMAAALAGAVGLLGVPAASATPANGPAIDAAAAAGNEVLQVQYWHHRHYYRRYWGYRHYYWRHRYWRHRHWY